METADPRVAMDDPKVPVRAAAARDLARHGTWDDLERIVAKGWGDRSMAVRIYMAAAAADVVGRRRGALGQDRLSDAEQAQVLKWAFAGDPGTNPSMLMLAGAVETEASLHRLGRIVRDPRSDVRLGVVTALRRMVLSSMSNRAFVAERVASWLEDERLPDDTRAELAEVVGEAGLSSLRAPIAALRRRGEALAEVVDRALDRLDARARRASWAGLWRSEGLDVFELALAPREDRVALSSESAWYGPDGAADLVLDGEAATLGGRPASLVWATPLGTHEPALALQVDGRTWWAVPPASVADAIDEHVATLRGLPADAFGPLRALLDRTEGANAQRAGAVLAVLAGDAADALARIDALGSKRKPRADLLFWRARALADAGRRKDALADLAAFLEKAKKGHPLTLEAEALRTSLGG
jgi:hypothetical protein